MDELKTVKTANFEADLAIAKSYLIDNGIECVISGEYLTIAMGGIDAVRLQVMSENYQRAIELLKKGGFLDSND
ncbi:putative signal transducing protein [Dysgonomonas sp. BGC7]|uniref:putative signal transducing protein n=1 Tax=Dysgonomonas sp. BGC7 TaxID=1658008 RepID=UPI0006828FFD|nr:DUF2007 domain-containing protein [Dysgonomonas sp. BGC7]MBD8388034.1 DUF2007 domain-containing protein [Dysgonomonas sp. BGC7]